MIDDCGIVEGMIRISAGLKSSKDITKDLLSALDEIQQIPSFPQVVDFESGDPHHTSDLLSALDRTQQNPAFLEDDE